MDNETRSQKRTLIILIVAVVVVILIGLTLAYCVMASHHKGRFPDKTYINGVDVSGMTAQRAKCKGFHETVFHRGEIVTECAHSNVPVLKDGVFYSHPNDEFILRGIAKTHMIQACYRLGIPVLEKPYTFEFLKNADEIIVSSSSNFCLHASSLNGQPVGGKDPATLKAIQDEVLREFFAYTGCTTLEG